MRIGQPVILRWGNQSLRGQVTRGAREGVPGYVQVGLYNGELHPAERVSELTPCLDDGPLAPVEPDAPLQAGQVWVNRRDPAREIVLVGITAGTQWRFRPRLTEKAHVPVKNRFQSEAIIRIEFTRVGRLQATPA